MIDRYRKQGGFIQLVMLLETCGPAKKEKFLEIIRQEAPVWADELARKTIDIDRIFSWNDETLAEIVGTLQDLCLAVSIAAATEDLRTRLYGMLTHGRRRKIDDLLGRTPPAANEVATMHMKIVETVRKMALDGFLRFEKFDASLLIEDGIEAKLDKKETNEGTSASIFAIEYSEGAEPASKADSTPSSAATDESRASEISYLRKKLGEAGKEIAVLRHELNVARGKLEQIKKIA